MEMEMNIRLENFENFFKYKVKSRTKRDYTKCLFSHRRNKGDSGVM